MPVRNTNKHSAQRIDEDDNSCSDGMSPSADSELSASMLCNATLRLASIIIANIIILRDCLISVRDLDSKVGG